MAKVLKSKYSSAGERCVDACLNYGVLRYVNEDKTPISIEIPFDKYDAAISDFEDRIREGLTQSEMDPKSILKRGSITYTQAKNIAMEGTIKGIEYYDIDGSVECEHLLGISGSIEYALSLWNGETKEEAIKKALIRSIKIYGEDFIKRINLENTSEEYLYITLAKSIQKVENLIDVELYRIRHYNIDNEIYTEDFGIKQKISKSIDLPLGFLGAFIGFVIVQLITNMGSNIDNEGLYLGINIVVMLISSITIMRVSKNIKDRQVKEKNLSVMEMFNDELERASYENLLTKKECKLILKNITKGEISKLLIDMKGSINKKISSNTIVNKETRFILDGRKIIVLPSEYEVYQSIENLVSKYKDILMIENEIDDI